MNCYRWYWITAIFLLLVIPSQLFAQDVSNVRARLDGDNVIITYDLSGSSNSVFTVTLYSSADGYSTPLQQVIGDVGENQTPGNNKNITWRAKSELGVYSGDITFEVRSLATFIPLRITRPSSGNNFKPGSNLPIRWEGGAIGATMRIELMRNNVVDQSIGSQQNTGQYDWKVPSDISPGGNYQVRLFDASDPGKAVLSGQFNFKGKSGGGGKGLWWKIGIPVVAGGVLAAVLLGGNNDGGGNGGGGEQTNDLPTPPDDPSGGISVYNQWQLKYSNQ